MRIMIRPKEHSRQLAPIVSHLDLSVHHAEAVVDGLAMVCDLDAELLR
jgi:hypothetical protein